MYVCMYVYACAPDERWTDIRTDSEREADRSAETDSANTCMHMHAHTHTHTHTEMQVWGDFCLPASLPACQPACLHFCLYIRALYVSTPEGLTVWVCPDRGFCMSLHPGILCLVQRHSS